LVILNERNYNSDMSAVKIKAEKTNEGLTVYVDPMAGFIYLKVVTGESGVLKMTVTDQQGKIVNEQNIPANQLTSIPLTGLPQGFYNVKVILSNTELNEVFRF
jgi:hypothetical protein